MQWTEPSGRERRNIRCFQQPKTDICGQGQARVKPSLNRCKYCNNARIIIIIFVTTFMHGIYNYMPETVTRVHSIAALLYLQYMLHMLLAMLNMVCTCTLAFPAVCVQCPIWLLYAIPLHRAFPLFSERFWDGSSGPVSRSSFHSIWCISIVKYSFLRIFSASSSITFLSLKCQNYYYYIITITTTTTIIIPLQIKPSGFWKGIYNSLGGGSARVRASTCT